MRWPALATVLFIGYCGNCSAQEPDTLSAMHMIGFEYHEEWTLLAGYQQGTWGFAELSMGRSGYATGHLPVGWGYYLGGEMCANDPDVVGLKVGAFITGGMGAGLQLIQYSDGRDSGTVLRPEIGIGLFKGKMTYAYNVLLAGERPHGVNTHMICLSYAFRLLRLPKDVSYRQ